MKKRSLYAQVRFGLNLILFLMLMGFASCSTVEYMNFQVLKPGKVIIPADVKTLAFVDRNVYYSKDTSEHYYKFNDEFRKDSLRYDTLIARSCYQGFIDNLSEYLRRDTIPFVQLDSTVRDDSLRIFPVLSWDVVDSICAENGSDIIVGLEDIGINNKYIVDGNLYDGFYGSNDISYWVVWRIYDPLYKKIYDEHLAADSLFYEDFSSSYRVLVNGKLPDRKATLMDVAYTIGEEYAKRISPHWESVNRPYYCVGDKRFAAACYYLKEDNLDQAITLWEAAIDEKDPKKSGRAAYNISLAYELKGDLKNSVAWIRKSVYFYKMAKNPSSELAVAEKYALELMDRRNDEDLLKIFFGE